MRQGWVGILLMLAAVVSAFAQVVPVASLGTPTQVSPNFLKSAFLGRTNTWPDGQALTVFVLDDQSPDHLQFSKVYLHLFPQQLRRKWDRMVFSGTGKAPERLKNFSQMKDRLSRTQGALGYFPSDAIGDAMQGLEVKK